jgi:hypothetical protein
MTGRKEIFALNARNQGIDWDSLVGEIEEDVARWNAPQLFLPPITARCPRVGYYTVSFGSALRRRLPSLPTHFDMYTNRLAKPADQFRYPD